MNYLPKRYLPYFRIASERFTIKEYYLNGAVYLIYKCKDINGSDKFIVSRETTLKEKLFLKELLNFNNWLLLELYACNNMREAINLAKKDSDNQLDIKDIFGGSEHHKRIYNAIKLANIMEELNNDEE